MEWTQYLVLLGPVTAGVLGITVVWAKASKIMKAFTEIGDVFHSIGAAMEDKTITAEESKYIWKQIKEAGQAIKGIVK